MALHGGDWNRQARQKNGGEPHRSAKYTQSKGIEMHRGALTKNDIKGGKTMKELKVKITFAEDILGTESADPELFSTYIASKAPDAKSKAEEIELNGAEEFERKGTTCFPRDESGKPMLWDYQIKGFFKSAAKAQNYIGEHKLSAYKSKIDLLVFVNERRIPLQLPEGAEVGCCQRPLRGSTPQGETVSIASSETCPAGTSAEFTIKVLQDSLMADVKRWLDYGALNGIGQWRNSGKGRFSWEEVA